MTGNNNKSRAVFLAALMVFSVFAGTVAFSGSAAAAEPTFNGNAVQYQNNSSDYVIEVPFDGDVDPSKVDNTTIKLLDDGDDATANVHGFDYREGAVYIVLDNRVPSNDLEIEITEALADGGNNNVTNPGTYSVAFASQTLEFDNVGGTTKYPPGNTTVYQGSTIAVNASNGSNGPAANVPVTVEGEDITFFREGSTGVNSSVYTFNSDNRELGKYRIFLGDDDSAGNRTFITIRDLQLDVEVDDLSVTTEDNIEADVSSAAGGRDVEVDLLDSNGDSLNTSDPITLDGQGEGTVTFDAGSADEGEALDAGNYTLEVTDLGSGVSVESSSVSVSEAGDDEADFVDNTITDQRGDVIEFSVETEGTDTSTVVFGTPEDGVVANATLVDDDGDNQVTAYLNTTALDGSTQPFLLDSDSDDEIDRQNQGSNTVSDLIDAGEYDLEVRPGSSPTAESTDVATVILEERGTQAVNTWTVPNGVSISDLEDVNEAAADGDLTQTTDIANGDKVVHEVQASGLEGVLNTQNNEGVTTKFFEMRQNVFNFTVEQTDAGANQDPWHLKLTSSNTTVVADGDNDTYYIVVNTQTANIQRSGNSIPDDEGLTANFTVIQDDLNGYGDFTNNNEYDDDENEETLTDYDVVEPEINVDEPYNVSSATEQSVSGDTTLAPGTELRLRVRSDDGVRPSFLKTASPVVQSDRTWSATFDFSEQSVGDTYEISVSKNTPSASVTEDGTVVEAMMTTTEAPDTTTEAPDTTTEAPDTTTEAPDTTTEEPATETPTSTPGFGVVVALTALIAAALLAIRRD